VTELLRGDAEAADMQKAARMARKADVDFMFEAST
jgi:hypothetical protein